MVRRVVGASMLPTLKPGQIVLAITTNPKVGQVVIADYGGRQVIKRLTKLSTKKAYILGDNRSSSTDSRDYGWIDKQSLMASVIWPKA